MVQSENIVVVFYTLKTKGFLSYQKVPRCFSGSPLVLYRNVVIHLRHVQEAVHRTTKLPCDYGKRTSEERLFILYAFDYFSIIGMTRLESVLIPLVFV